MARTYLNDQIENVSKTMDLCFLPAWSFQQHIEFLNEGVII